MDLIKIILCFPKRGFIALINHSNKLTAFSFNLKFFTEMKCFGEHTYLRTFMKCVEKNLLFK